MLGGGGLDTVVQSKRLFKSREYIICVKLTVEYNRVVVKIVTQYATVVIHEYWGLGKVMIR